MEKFLLFWLPLSIIFIGTSVFGWVMVIGSRLSKSRYDETRKSAEDYQTDYGRVIQLYEVLARFPLTSKSTNQLHDIISGLSIYNDLEQRIETARIAGISYLMCLIVLTTTIIVTGGNPVICVTTFVMVVAFRRDMVNKRLRKRRLRFWEELLVTLTSIQQEYERSKNLNTALTMCQAQETVRYLVSNIEYILKSDDPESSLSYFCVNNPFHICIRLAYLCYTTHTYSPKFIEKEGTNSFLSGLDLLISDLRVEIDIATKEKKKFYKVEKLPLVGLLFTFGGPFFMQKYFTGLKYYYNDGIGFLTLIATIIVVVGSYIVSTRLNDKDQSQEDVTAWELKRFEDTDFAEKWLNRAGDRVLHFQQMIDKSLSYLTPAMFMFRKTVFGLSCFVLGLAICVGYVLVERHSLQTNYKTIPESVLTTLETHYEDYNFVIKKAYDDPNITNQEQVYEYFKSQGWNMNESELLLFSTQIYNNKTKMNSTQFTPFHLAIAFVCLLVGYNLPDIMLERRAKLVKYEAEAEVLLLQAVVCQLMYTPLKLKDYLIFFSSISKLYADTHLLCYVHHFNNPEQLKTQAYRMFNPTYYQLMEQLYSLHSTLKPTQTFRETSSARRYLAVKFLESRQEILNTNYGMLSFLLQAALFVPVALQVVFPLASFVAEALAQYSSMMPQ